MKSRTVFGFASVAALVLVGVAGFIAGSKSSSDTESTVPPAEPITTPIVLQALAEVVTAQGVVEGDSTIDVFFPSQTSQPGIVSWLPRPGTSLAAGDVVAEISGLPLLLLRGEFGLFEDPGLGRSGRDIETLQSALKEAGFNPGDIDGVYGEETEHALFGLLEHNGYEAPSMSAEDELALQLATAAHKDALLSFDEVLTNAKDEQRSAEDEVAEMTSLRDAAEEALESASARLDKAESGSNPDTGLPPTPDELQALREEVDAAQAALDSAEDDLEAALVALSRMDASHSVEQSRNQVRTAEIQLRDIQNRTRARVLAGQLVFVDPLPVVVEGLPLAVGDPATGPVVQLGYNHRLVVTTVTQEVGSRIEIGEAVSVEVDGRQLDGIVESVKASPDTTTDHVTVSVEGAFVSDIGLPALISYELASTDGAVLTVPSSALFFEEAAAFVLLAGSDLEPNKIDVDVGVSADGWSEIRSRDDRVREGARVVVER